MPIQQNSSNKNIPAINGLKGICAFVIAFNWHYHHFAPTFPPMYHIFKPFYDCGHLAVVIFFMLSGLGMSIGYEDRLHTASIRFIDFILTRIKKIYPIMILSTIVTAILQLIYYSLTGNIFQYSIEHFDIYHFVLSILGLQYGFFGEDFSFNGPTWFISILLICYIVFYAINALVKKHLKLLPWLYAITILLGYAMLLLCNESHILVNTSVGYGLASFFTGCMLARLYLLSRNVLTTVLGYTALLITLVTAIIAYASYYLLSINTQVYTMIIYSPMLIIAIFFIPWFQQALALYPFIKLGELSIFMYMWHFPVQIVWSIINQLLGQPIMYESPLIWILYITSVLMVSKTYQLLLSCKINHLFEALISKLRFNSTIHSSKG